MSTKGVLCDCKKEAALYQSTKAGKNRNRYYYVCKDDRCKYFRWKDSVANKYEYDDFCVPDDNDE